MRTWETQTKTNSSRQFRVHLVRLRTEDPHFGNGRCIPQTFKENFTPHYFCGFHWKSWCHANALTVHSWLIGLINGLILASCTQPGSLPGDEHYVSFQCFWSFLRRPRDASKKLKARSEKARRGIFHGLSFVLQSFRDHHMFRKNDV